MKKPFPILDCRLPIAGHGAGDGSPLPNRKSQIVNRKSERGVALVITLILLSVTLVMAVAFLALSRRDRSSVGTTTDTAAARLAAESALAQAQALMVANALTYNGYTNVGLLVSTNYINPYGFRPGVASPTNVNFDYLFNNAPWNAPEFEQAVANLQILPRVPVFQTNYIRGVVENSFYLDLNQNGVFDTNNWADGTKAYGPGDPEWIGVLERPDAPHSANNPFTSRYAFIAVPADGSLDLNYIHNQAYGKEVNSSPTNFTAVDSYMRNQSVGTWELNLAAFLTDLNTNEWDPVIDDYVYNPQNPPNRGRGFEDALALLSWRYNFNYNTLASADQVFPNTSPDNAATIFPNDGIDNYSDGALQTNFDTNVDYLPAFSDDPRLPWVGADNTNKYYDLSSELFDTSKAPSFAANLSAISQAHTVSNTNPVDYYNDYTFYRLLDQLGTGSQPEEGKINLNYSNAVVTYDRNGVPTGIGIVPGAETNLVSWRPMDFFVAAANQMLRTYTSNWFRGDYRDYEIVVEGNVTNIIYHSPSNYLATYYNIYTNYFSFIDAEGRNVWNDPSGYGLTNLPVYGVTNRIPVFGVTNIPVYENTNFVYQPSVNRVLQLAANLYDASTTNFYPTVFRPILEHDNFGNITIVGFTNLFSFSGGFNTVTGSGDPQLASPFVITALTNYFANFTPLKYNIGPASGYNVNVYGVPWILGAKKGFPSFNKLGMEDAIQVSRKLQVARKDFPSDGALKPSDFAYTNQLYNFSISKTIGVECWNSYGTTYSNKVFINVQDVVSMWITNSYNLPPTYFSDYVMTTNISVQPWPGYQVGSPNSFVVPLYQTAYLLTNDDFYFGTSGPKGFQPEIYNYGWETNRYTFDLPVFGLLTTNQLQLSMLDYSGVQYHVIDYVQLDGPNKIRNINAALQTNSTILSYDNMWSVANNAAGVPYGIINQWDASIKSLALNTAYWKPVSSISYGGILGTPQSEIDGFCAFLGLAQPFTSLSNPTIMQYYTNNYIVQVPYSPSTLIYDYTGWQANDPLVHYISSDLIDNSPENGNNLEQQMTKLLDTITTFPQPSYTTLNERYQPWGLNKQMAGLAQAGTTAVNTNAYNLTCKDPLVWRSDSWDFPTNRYPSVGWIGRVHRGTPWQTVYLKAHNVMGFLDSVGDIGSGTNTWIVWTGDYNAYDAVNSGPLQDRLLFDLFTAAPDENASYGQLSVNQTNLASWSAVLSGMVAITNTTPVATAITTLNPLNPPTYGWYSVQPAGAFGLNSALGNIVTGINDMRTNFINPDGVAGSFEHKGDILSTLQLTEQSPYLGWTNAVKPQYTMNEQVYTINDEAYEWLPQHLMSLLNCPTAQRYVVYCYGQTLKPAPNSLVPSGSFFGLCTNYQVVAESAVRAVVQLHPVVVLNPNGGGFMTNYTTTVESFTTLPAY
jgi:hypothetical protein